MNSKTKIVVIRQRHLIVGLAAFLAALLLFILALLGMFSGKEDSGAQKVQSAIYRAGVYTASVTLNGSPMDIRLTVDENNINDIELFNVSETVTTMYPLLQTSFEDIRSQVIESGSTQGIHFSNENTYSASMLTAAIDLALKKADIKPGAP